MDACAFIAYDIGPEDFIDTRIYNFFMKGNTV